MYVYFMFFRLLLQFFNGAPVLDHLLLKYWQKLFDKAIRVIYCLAKSFDDALQLRLVES
jgi:hypothetical protein